MHNEMDEEELSPGEIAWRLIHATDPETIRQLEAVYGETQAAAVDEMIEESCWSEDMAAFVGGKGTPAERREALIAAEERAEAEIEDDADETSGTTGSTSNETMAQTRSWSETETHGGGRPHGVSENWTEGTTRRPDGK